MRAKCEKSHTTRFDIVPAEKSHTGEPALLFDGEEVERPLPKGMASSYLYTHGGCCYRAAAEKCAEEGIVSW